MEVDFIRQIALVSRLFSEVLVVSTAGLLLLNASSDAREQNCRTHQHAPLANRSPDLADLRRVVAAHAEWLASSRSPEDPRRADFRCAKLIEIQWEERLSFRPDLRLALFDEADLRGANFRSMSLEGASFNDARLEGANFVHAKLTSSDFTLANLMRSVFRSTDIAGANFTLASLHGAWFQPEPVGLSSSFRRAFGFASLDYERDASALYELREIFKRSGRRDLEREVTFAIESERTFEHFLDGEWLLAAGRFVGFELTTKYDLEPSRALVLIAALIVLFSGPYYLALTRDPGKIWKVLPSDRIGGNAQLEFEEVRPAGTKAIGYALLFSLLSAFHLGWRDLNVGSWLSRLQASEFSLRAVGWVRTLSGIQSLLTVYLLAMWALTQFGRLFEG